MDLSAGAAILEDPRPAAGAAAAASTHHFVIFHLGLWFTALAFLLFGNMIFRGYFVCTYSYMDSDTVMYDAVSLLYPA